MNKDWLVLIKKYTLSGARDRFETICTTLFKKIYSGRTVRSVKVKKGDGGVDVFVGDIGVEPIHVIQCKYFSNDFGDSQKSQIRDSFQTAIKSKVKDKVPSTPLPSTFVISPILLPNVNC
mgnify:CR=1 FL=1